MAVTITDDFSNKQFYFTFFNSFEDFREKGQSAYNEIKAKEPDFFYQWDKGSISEDFVESDDRDFLNEGKFIEYVKKNDLNKSIDAFEELFATIDMGGSFKKSRLKITDDPRGIFDFGLASKGLYEVQEYFSEELAKESPDEFPGIPSGIVPPDYVMKDVFDNFWYNSIIRDKKYQMKQQQKGTRELELGMPGAALEYATTTRKSYLMFEKKGGKAKMVDLFVGIGGLGDMKSTGMLARALPLFIAARYFEMAGIKTRINGVRMSSDGAGFYTADAFTIKDYGEDLDFNGLAIGIADPRFFRWNLWKYCRALMKKNHDIDENWGGGATVYGGSRLYETANRYKNWYFNEMRKGSFSDLAINRNLMIFGGLENPPSRFDMRKDQSVTQDIKNEFYRILDIVDFQFNKPEIVAKRIYDRIVVEDGRSISAYDRYINSILSQAYSYPKKGQYATEPEEQDSLEAQYDVALNGVNNFISTLN